MREFFYVIWMACKDLRHDRRMTICLVLTVAAIALPLLLFFGLKNGVVEVMRQRMINDPSFMEVIPQGTATLDAEWFTTWKNNKHVGFVVPKTRELGVGGTFSNVSGTGKSVRADMQPTDEGDWLLINYRIQIPKEKACVLTDSLAQKLSIKQGEQVEIKISRQKKGGGLEYASLKFLVSDILPKQATGRDLAFLPLMHIERMEAFRDGFGVEEYGWKGDQPVAYPVFYGGLLYTRNAINPVVSAQIRQRTGFIRINEVLEFSKQDWHVVSLESGNNPISLFKLQELRNILRGQEMAFIPFVGKIDDSLQIILQEGKASPTKIEKIQVISSPLWASDLWFEKNQTGQDWPTNEWSDINKIPAAILLNVSVATQFTQGKAYAQFKTQDGESVNMLLHVLANNTVPTNTAIIAPGLAARLNLLFTRPLEVVQLVKNPLPKEVNLSLGRQNYSRFRMYARSLDDVGPLATQLEREGVIVKTRAADIERVKRMDQYLSLILGLIASAAITGGAICLLASLYASVERKRKALAVLRLLGIHGSTLCAFPLTAGFVMTGLGMLLSLILFHFIAFYMNYLAQDFILPGEVLCKLGIEQQLLSIMLALVSAMIAGLAAATRLLKIEAAESLRDE